MVADEHGFQEGMDVIQLQGQMKEVRFWDIRESVILDYLRTHEKATLSELSDELGRYLGKVVEKEATRHLVNTLVRQKRLNRSGQGVKGSPFVYTLGEIALREEMVESRGLCDVCKREEFGTIVNDRFLCWKHSGKKKPATGPWGIPLSALKQFGDKQD